MTGSILIRRRSLLASSAATLLLGACGTMIGPPPASQLYTLQPGKVPVMQGTKVDWSLSIAMPTAPSNLASNRISLQRGDQLDYYANAELPETLTGLIQTDLLEAFEASGRIDRVARSADSIRADYLLQTDIRNFEAQYGAADGAPVVVVRIVTRMVGVMDRRIISTVIADQKIPASRDSMAAVLDAMNQGLGSALGTIVSWALTMPNPPVAEDL